MRQLMWFLFLLLTVPNILANVAFGQDEQPPVVQRAPITTDRPGFTIDSNMMAPGEYQIELGLTAMDSHGTESSSTPEALFRYGLNDKFELRLGWDGYTFRDNENDFASGIILGWKKKLKDPGEKFLFDYLDDFSLALISKYTLPTGHGPNSFETSTVIGWNLKLDETTSLSGNVGYASPTDIETSDRFIQGLASVMVKKSMGEATSVFGEIYTNVPDADDSSEEYVIQGGFTHRLNNDSQVDFRAGFGLNDQSPDWLVGVGFSRRF